MMMMIKILMMMTMEEADHDDDILVKIVSVQALNRQDRQSASNTPADCSCCKTSLSLSLCASPQSASQAKRV